MDLGELLQSLVIKNSEFLDELIQENLDKRILVLNDEISVDILEKYSLYIMKWNAEDKDLPVEKRKPIWLYLQTPGGDVVAGFNLVDVIQASETPVYTVCFSDCASMGFHIFISGHKRYAFKNSILLIHDGEITVNNSSSKAKDTMKFFETLDKRIKNHVTSSTKITNEFYDSIYDKEYYIYANEEGKELGCVDYIIGEDVPISTILVG